MKNHTFKSELQVNLNQAIPQFAEAVIKNEPMLFNCDYKTARQLQGPITEAFLDNLSPDWRNAPDLIIDSRVHMLMKGWFPCIPGYHHDDIPRSRKDKQPNYDTPEYEAEHLLCLVNGNIAPTEFAIGNSEFPRVAEGEVCYKVWHPLVEEKIKHRELIKVSAPSNVFVYFNCYTWHQGVRAVDNGWRWFIRCSRNTGRKPTNELRRQVQVYLEHPMEGW